MDESNLSVTSPQEAGSPCARPAPAGELGANGAGAGAEKERESDAKSAELELDKIISGQLGDGAEADDADDSIENEDELLKDDDDESNSASAGEAVEDASAAGGASAGDGSAAETSETGAGAAETNEVAGGASAENVGEDVSKKSETSGTRADDVDQAVELEETSKKSSIEPEIICENEKINLDESDKTSLDGTEKSNLVDTGISTLDETEKNNLEESEKSNLDEPEKNSLDETEKFEEVDETEKLSESIEDSKREEIGDAEASSTVEETLSRVEESGDASEADKVSKTTETESLSKSVSEEEAKDANESSTIEDDEDKPDNFGLETVTLSDSLDDKMDVDEEQDPFSKDDSLKSLGFAMNPISAPNDDLEDTGENSKEASVNNDEIFNDQSNNIEYVDFEENLEDLERDDNDNIDEDKDPDESHNTSSTLTNDEENPLFIQDSEKEQAEKDSQDSEEIINDSFSIENEEGADEELCIIPDTDRIISEAEKEAAIAIPPLKDITEASTTTEGSEISLLNESQNEETPTDKFIVTKYTKEDEQECKECLKKQKASFSVTKNTEVQYLCSDICFENFKTVHSKDLVLKGFAEIRVKNLITQSRSVSPTPLKVERRCVVCKKHTNDEETNLTWEIMDFCNEFCLSKYQKEVGSSCASCHNDVRANSLGKYCVRFGNDIRQFCSSTCLEEYKKGLKVCSYCQEDMSGESDGFLAPVGDKGQFKDFCSQACMEKYDIMTNNRPPKVPPGTMCSVCKTNDNITIEYTIEGQTTFFCGDPCFVAYSFVNNIKPAKCSMCRRYHPTEVLEKNTMFYDNIQFSFCSNSCQNIYIIAHRKIVPCAWCKVKKYNFDMIRRYFKQGPVLNMCSINCLSFFQVSVNAVNSKRTICNFCQRLIAPAYHLTMSDATLRNFCSYTCVMAFQNKFKKSPITLSSKSNDEPIPTGEPKKNTAVHPVAAPPPSPPLPVITNVQSLAAQPKNGSTSSTIVNRRPKPTAAVQGTKIEQLVRHHVIIKPPAVVEQRNVAIMTKPRQLTKGTNTRTGKCEVGCQTDDVPPEKVIIPIPVPIYIPAPLPMYSLPAPFPLPFPLPIPVPIFIPTTRNSAKGIMKEIKKIQVKIPTDPYEAELLMMAEMVAEDKKDENTDSDSDGEDAAAPPSADVGGFSPEPADASNAFGDDMLQMALKLATEGLEEPAVDLEGALTASTITANQGMEGEEGVDDPQPYVERSYRGRKRGRGAKQGTKRRRTAAQHVEAPTMPVQAQAQMQEPQEKPDAHLCLKYTFGVNAWKQWVTTKNVELEKQAKFSKPFKTEILQLTSDELNFSLCLFVKEVRKPNGAEYAPDTIYYLCLGIQQYLFENSRIDNIFCDPYYEQFTDSLDEIARKFSVLYNDSHYIVTRVEEEHLWESKQLGAHSPHVLLSTLMFFNTKHFNLTSVQEHMQLSFSHIMKHWRRNPNATGNGRAPGARNVLLRFYPPQSTTQNNSRKKKMYEQQENDDNPLRCPVKLYEFYLSKCPESVKTRNDVFYLQPERSCVPDSPVWYSTSALAQDSLEKMLHRVKMVKEINVALLTS